ncbi:MAG TPA: DUF4382 domain-containing protein [Gammaproteobacteria bacterium]|nr:DUF4382 domain-containing protein [Gammaproteobacteria bacterium]
MTKGIAASIVLLATFALAGCNSGGTGGTGTMSVAVTDAPVDSASSVVIQFSSIEIKPASGAAQTFTLSKPQQIDLMQYQDGKSLPLFQDRQVAAGHYEWMRLGVDCESVSAPSGNADPCYLKNATGTFPLRIPSGAQTGLKLVKGFDVPVGGTASFTVDFQLHKSVVAPQNGSTYFSLKPVLRIVDNSRAGAISGTVGTSLNPGGSGCTPAVYVYSGSNVAPTDLGGSGSTQPLLVAPVKLDSQSGKYRYKAAFLSAGDYTVAFTCDAAQDNPDQADPGVSFSSPDNATVTANRTTKLSFP